MEHDEARDLIPLALDRELDARGQLALETHLADCPACRAQADAAAALRSAVRRDATSFAAPAALRARIVAALPGETGTAPTGFSTAATPVVSATPRPATRGRLSGFKAIWGWRLLNGGGLAAGLAAALVLLIGWPQRHDDALADAAIADHARAVMTDHLTDVLSSDQHTVKPWLSGRLDYSPPVKDYADAGFPLVGGRLDYLDQRPVAALVYRHRQHLIDVFVWPTAAAADAGASGATPTLRSDRGWHVLGWSDGGLSWRAVSDVDPADLRQLAALMVDQAH